MESLEGRSLLSLAASQLLGSTTTSVYYETTSAKLDAAGNTVVGGSFFGTVDLDPTRTYGDNRDILTSSGARDAFVAKFGPDGSVLWSRSVGATKDDRVAGVALDAAGNVYAAGFVTDQVNFGNGLSINATGRADLFVWKLNGATGSSVYVNHAVGQANLSNQAQDVTVTPGGEAIVSGFIVSSTTFGGTTITPAAQPQGVVARLDAAGNFTWAVTYDAGATNRSFFERVTLDKDGNILVTGAVGNAGNGNGDILIRKLNGSNGSTLWTRTIGGPGYDAGSDIVTDPVSGDVYTVGRFVGPVDFNPAGNTPGDTPNAPIGNSSFYVLKLDGATGNYQWVRDLGARNGNVIGTTNGIGRPSVALDPVSGRILAAVAFQGRAVVVPGQVFSPGPDGKLGTGDDIIGTGGITFDSQNGTIDTMLVRLDAASGSVIEARRAGGNGIDVPTGLATRAGRPEVVLVGTHTNPGTPSYFHVSGLSLSIPAGVAQGAEAVYMVRFTERYASQGPTSDFDGDGRGDLVVYDPMRSDIFLKLSTNQAVNRRIFGPGALFTGTGGAINQVAPQTVLGDFDGDGLTDVAVFRPDTSQFYTLYSDLQNVLSPPANVNIPPTTLISAQPFFFGPGSVFTGFRFNPIPLAGDIDGDGRDDLIVYEPMSSTFYVLPSNPGSSAQAIQFGPSTSNSAAFAPVPFSADVNGDGRDDLVVYRPDTATFYVRLSGATLTQHAGTESFTFGPATPSNRFQATPIVGDFNGDNKAEFGVYNPMESRILLRNTAIYYNGVALNNIQFGPAPTAATTAPPTLGVSDFNGDGRDDIVVYDPMTSRSFTIINAPTGTATAHTFGPALNATRNAYAPTAPPSPAVASLNPYRTMVGVLGSGGTRVALNVVVPPAETTVTPVALTPVIGRRRVAAPTLSTLG